MDIIHVNENSFQKAVLDSPIPVIVDFWANWCPPCRMLAPILEEIAAERSDVLIAKVDVDENTGLAVRYGISSIPNVILFKGGEPAASSVGLVPKEALLARLGL